VRTETVHLERRESPRPVAAVSGFVQGLLSGQAQWACAFCGQHDVEDSLFRADTALRAHLAAEHAGWALQAVPSRREPLVADQGEYRGPTG
jgi:hypothetical protein